jgi:hypothetical protein
VPAPFGFLCKKSVVSLAEVMAAFFSSLIAGARLFLLCSWLLAQDGGPPLVSGCCGSPWAADRPTSGRFPAFLR